MIYKLIFALVALQVLFFMDAQGQGKLIPGKELIKLLFFTLELSPVKSRLYTTGAKTRIGRLKNNYEAG